MFRRMLLAGFFIVGALYVLFAAPTLQAAEWPSWGPGHGMMWGGPTRNWYGWGQSEHICGEAGQRNVDRFMTLIDRAITPTEAQKPAEEALKGAFEAAQQQLVSLCEKPHSGRWSPIERIAVAEAHLNSMLIAIKTVRPALEAFYGILSDDQRKKMDELRPDWRMHMPWAK
ncbi:MAG: Spy/CpxP family protein refolding chaperone [Pseudomonadota bacterium]